MPEKASNGRAESAFPPVMMPFGFDAFMHFHRPELTPVAQMNGTVYHGIVAMI
jgi:hypothetical protein